MLGACVVSVVHYIETEVCKELVLCLLYSI